jgi:drug/metabolite transporter (DMT)-like permease
MKPHRSAPGLALAAALLFGASAPAAKALVGVTDPWLLAGLLYLGSGLGLGIYHVVGRLVGGRTREAPIGRRDAVWLAAAIAVGGVIAPILMLFALAIGSAAQTSLLLNLEGVFTALMAWLVFREAFSARIAVGMGAIGLGAAILARDPAWGVVLDPGAVLAIGACLAWAADNNLTRRVSGSDPITIAALKGTVAGLLNLSIAIGRGAAFPEPRIVLAAGAVGLLGYGVSLALFILALRHLGAARAGAYFSTAPFIGALGGVTALGEPVTGPLIVAAALMAIGVWLHLGERHDHEHVHEPMTHDHLHVHDAHHGHAHPAAIPLDEPHAHPHAHGVLRHRHPHYPDLHHRHGH